MNQLSETGRRFFLARGIDPETAAHYGAYTTQPDDDNQALVIPYMSRGEQINAKYRRSGKRFSMKPDAPLLLWNCDVLDDPALSRDEHPAALVICEGEIDALSFIEAGYPFVVSVPNGAPAKPTEGAIDPEDDAQRYAYVWRDWQRLAKVKRFILATDGDGPGHALRADLTRRLLIERCAVVDYPEGCKDANEVLLKHGREGVSDMLARAKPVPVQGLYRLQDFAEQGEPVRYVTGWERLDDHLSLCPGLFYVVTGIPGHGKSTFINSLLVKACKLHNWSVAIGSFESPPVPFLRHDLRRAYLQANPKTAAFERIAEADVWINRHILFLAQNPADDETDFDVDKLLELAAVAVVRDGIRALVVDPWNEIEHKRRRDESETDYIGRAIRALKRFAKRYDVAVIVVAHPTKAKAGDVPGLYDISGSANWANKADFGLVVHRPDAAGPNVEISVRKVRFGTLGKPGTVDMIFDAESGTYEPSMFDAGA